MECHLWLLSGCYFSVITCFKYIDPLTLICWLSCGSFCTYSIPMAVGVINVMNFWELLAAYINCQALLKIFSHWTNSICVGISWHSSVRLSFIILSVEDFDALCWKMFYHINLIFPEWSNNVSSRKTVSILHYVKKFCTFL